MAPNLIQSGIIFSQSRQRFNGKDEIHSDFPIQPTISLAEKAKKKKKKKDKQDFDFVLKWFRSD